MRHALIHVSPWQNWAYTVVPLRTRVELVDTSTSVFREEETIPGILCTIPPRTMDGPV